LLSERVKLAAEKAAMVALVQVSLVRESGSLAQERLRLEHKKNCLHLELRLLKLKLKKGCMKNLMPLKNTYLIIRTNLRLFLMISLAKCLKGNNTQTAVTNMTIKCILENKNSLT